MEDENFEQNNKNRKSKLIRDVLMKKVYDQAEIFDYTATQQPRTLQKKIDFVENLYKVYGNISLACKLTGIKSRKTVYNWMHDDPEIRKVIEEMNEVQNDLAGDMLKYNIFVRRDGPSIRYYLSNRDPKYMKPKRLTTPPRKKETPEQMWARWEKMPWPEDEELHESV